MQQIPFKAGGGLYCGVQKGRLEGGGGRAPPGLKFKNPPLFCQINLHSKDSPVK